MANQSIDSPWMPVRKTKHDCSGKERRYLQNIGGNWRLFLLCLEGVQKKKIRRCKNAINMSQMIKKTIIDQHFIVLPVASLL